MVHYNTPCMLHIRHCTKCTLKSLQVMLPLDQRTLHVMFAWTLCMLCHGSGAKHFVSPHLVQLQSIAVQCSQNANMQSLYQPPLWTRPTLKAVQWTDNSTSKTDAAPWCYKWTGMDGWMDLWVVVTIVDRQDQTSDSCSMATHSHTPHSKLYCGWPDQLLCLQ